MKAAVFHGPGDIRVEDVADPSTSTDGVVIEVAACGVCGSDVHAYRRGQLVRPGQVLGHEFSGTVVEVGDEVTGVATGDRVVAMPFSPCQTCASCRSGRPALCETAFRRSVANGLPGGFADHVAVPGARVGDTIHHLPDHVSDEAGALVEPLAVGLQAVAQADPQPDQVAVVLGLGSVGLAVVHGLRARGVEAIVATDISAPRLAAARAAGITVVDGNDGDIEEAVRELTGPGAYGAPAAADVVFECSGAAPLLDRAVRMARMGGRVVMVALYGQAPPVDATLVVRKGLRLDGTFGYGGDQFAEAVRLLADGDVDPATLISHRFAHNHQSHGGVIGRMHRDCRRASIKKITDRTVPQH